MKIYWSAFLSLLFLLALAGCGAEQFGSKPQSNAEKPDALQIHEQASCAQKTLIKPEVDILYVVDNSSSSNWISGSIKSAIQGTINSISSQFDYRVIGTPLLKTANGDDDFQVLAKDQSTLPGSVPSSKRLSNSSQFSFFSGAAEDQFAPEAGLRRTIEFITAHQNDGLFRQNAHLLIVLVSNGKDYDIETAPSGVFDQNAFNDRKNSFVNVIRPYLNLQQIRLFSVTANVSGCKTGYYSSKRSYADMSDAILTAQGISGNDHFDLCSNSISGVFSSVNSTVQQVIIPHKYNRWPITYTDTPTGLNTASIKVYKSSPNSPSTLLPSSAWTYIHNPSGISYPTRVEPSVGEPTTSKHLIEFASGSEVVYPDCIQITSTSNPEYFGYVVVSKTPKLDSVVIKINGQTIPQSSSNGWSYIGMQTRNIKVSYNGFSDTPAAIRTGYMFQLNGGNNYYKSGDVVDVYYNPDSN